MSFAAIWIGAVRVKTISVKLLSVEAQGFLNCTKTIEMRSPHAMNPFEGNRSSLQIYDNDLEPQPAERHFTLYLGSE